MSGSTPKFLLCTPSIAPTTMQAFRRASLLAPRSRVALLPRLASRALCIPPEDQPLATKGLIHGVDELSNETLFMMAKTGDLTSCRERMIREVMAVDGVGRDAAKETTRAIAKKNAEGLFIGLLPYRVGISVAIASAWISIPAVFSLQFAKSFNTYFVTTEVPSKSELDTLLEVGSWTWNWMEPPLGTISFFLLCLQYARDQARAPHSSAPQLCVCSASPPVAPAATGSSCCNVSCPDHPCPPACPPAAQRINIGQKPWTDHYKSQSADQLAAFFPTYDKHIVRDYAKVTVFDDDSNDF